MWVRRCLFFAWVALALGRAFYLIAQPPTPAVLPAPVAQAAATGQLSWVVGEVVSVTRHGPHSVRFVFQVQARVHGPRLDGVQTFQPAVKVWLSWSHTDPQGPMASWGPRAGERWLLPLRWQTNRPSPTEGGFDAQRWMQQQELAALAWVAGGAAQPWGARRLGSGVSLMQALRQEVRDRIASVVVQPRLAGLVAALCMGDQNAIDPADWTIFRRTGVAHLVSISGLHVTLLAVWLAAWADRAMRVWRWRGQPWALYAPAPMVAQWVALAVAGLYAWFSGWGLPAQRTVWMLLATAFLRQLAWHWPPHALWLGLVASVACFDPLALSQPGFWLSYVAVGVLYTVQIGPIEHPLRRWLAETLQVQWRLSLALMPLCLWFYQGVSLAGLWVNLWAIPWVTLVLTPMSLLGLVWAPLWQVAAWAADALLRALAWAADSPWALLEVSRPSLPATVLATLLAVGVVVRWGLRWRCACAVGLWAVLG